MPVKYHRLTYKQRIAIYYLTRQGCSQGEIARQIEVTSRLIGTFKNHIVKGIQAGWGY